MFLGSSNSLPALIKAFRVQEKASGVGFDWDDSEDVLDKVKEELDEFKEEVTKNKINEMEMEFGDLLFSLINYARYLKINPESALELTNKKFIDRFKYIETEANKLGKKLISYH